MIHGIKNDTRSVIVSFCQLLAKTFETAFGLTQTKCNYAVIDAQSDNLIECSGSDIKCFLLIKKTNDSIEV
jgi:hypothetical protein